MSDVWLYSDGVIRKISDDGGYDINPSINNNSVVTWMRCESYFNLDCELVLWENGAVITVETPYPVHQSPKINDANQIVWAHDFSGSFDDVEVFLTGQGSTLQITDDEVANQIPRINTRGDIAWTRFDFSVWPWLSTIMFYSDGMTSELSGATFEPAGTDINEARRVVWGSADVGIELWDGKNVSVITDDGRAATINNLDEISFARFDDDSGNWIRWLFRDDQFYKLSSEDQSSGADAPINDRSEVIWRSIVNSLGDTAILFLRRVANRGDFDGDSYIDMRDARAMQLCVATSSDEPNGGLLGDCDRGDFDGDKDVDLQDFDLFLNVFTGPDESVP